MKHIVTLTAFLTLAVSQAYPQSAVSNNNALRLQNLEQRLEQKVATLTVLVQALTDQIGDVKACNINKKVWSASGCQKTLAERADEADLADKATLAVSAGYAEDAGFAKESALAKHADAADKAKKATNADKAAIATNAINARNAEHAQVAASANTAKKADTATKANTAKKAETADTAKVAVRAERADLALEAVKLRTMPEIVTLSKSENFSTGCTVTKSSRLKTFGDATYKYCRTPAIDLADLSSNAKSFDIIIAYQGKEAGKSSSNYHASITVSRGQLISEKKLFSKKWDSDRPDWYGFMDLSGNKAILYGAVYRMDGGYFKVTNVTVKWTEQKLRY